MSTPSKVKIEETEKVTCIQSIPTLTLLHITNTEISSHHDISPFSLSRQSNQPPTTYFWNKAKHGLLTDMHVDAHIRPVKNGNKHKQ